MATVPCPTCEEHGRQKECPLCKGKGQVEFYLWGARPGPSASKFGNERIKVDDLSFDSLGEAKRYGELKLLEREGKIEDLQVHPMIPLHSVVLSEADGQAHDYEEVCRYEADFSYTDVETGQFVLEDYKGHRTGMYKLKRKWVKAEYGIEIKEIEA